MKKIVLLSLLISGSVFSGQVGDWTATPEYLKLKPYKIAVSTSSDCTNLKTVFEVEESKAQYVDFFKSPSIGEGDVPAGTYLCVVIEMSDNIKYTSNENSPNGHCASGTESVLDVCGNNGSETVTLIDGTITTCSSEENRVALYLTTIAASDGSGSHNQNVWNPPSSTSDTDNGFKLGSPLVINGKSKSKFIVNGTDKLMEYQDNSSFYCEMQPPLFSFQKE